MVHNINKEEYLANPCKASSLSYYRNNNTNLPTSMKVIHRSSLDTAIKCEEYFRLLYALKEIEEYPKVPNGFHMCRADPRRDREAIMSIINNSYEDIKVDNRDYERWINTQVYCPSTWLILKNQENEPIAFVLAELDRQIGEGYIDWLQVLPKHRKQGLATVLIKAAIWHLKKENAKFITVSGKVNSEENVELLYRKCGFIGNDVWCIIR